MRSVPVGIVAGVATLAVGASLVAFMTLKADQQPANSSPALDRTVEAPDSLQAWRDVASAAASRTVGATLTGQPLVVKAYDDELSKVSEARFHDASSVEVSFAPGESRTWSIFVGRSTDPPQDDPCQRTLPENTVLACNSSIDPTTGDLVVELVTLAVKVPGTALAERYSFTPDARRIATQNPSHARLERAVKVFRSDGSLSLVTETVYGTKDLNPESAFEVPADLLHDLAVDPSLHFTLGP